MEIIKKTRNVVYVWEFPVRLYHWINAFCITVLIGTGLLIGHPLGLHLAPEASLTYWFGWVRFLHFATAFLFFFNFIFRLYWGLVGNEYSRWFNYIPIRKAQWKQIWAVIKSDVLLLKYDELSKPIGHNALASFTYFLSFLAFLLQCFTGFGMYAAMSQSWLAGIFAWVPSLLGGDMMTRQIHHITMWFFILFTMVHIYLVIYHDYIERKGTVSSIIGGWKFVNNDDD